MPSLSILRNIFMICALVALFLAGSGLPARADDAPPAIDWQRAQALMHKHAQGQQLTPDEQAFMQQAQAEHDRLVQAGKWPPPGFTPAGGGGGGRAATRPAGQGPAGPGMAPVQGPGGIAVGGKDSEGFIPLTQMKADQKYKGQDGGLYGGGQNIPPSAQQKLADAASKKIVPLDAQGKPAAARLSSPKSDGKIVLLSIGMSNTTGEYQRFKEVADADPDKNPHLTIVDGAQGGMTAMIWAGKAPAAAPPNAAKKVWETADQRIAAAGATPQQVQAIWLKQAQAQPARLGEFPKHAQSLTDDEITILNLAQQRYPNLRIAYLSSRIYAGYAGTNMLNPEPYAYEGAFAVRDVILDQIKGDPRLNADPAKGAVKSPVVLWGPYLWADGMKGREGDDLVWRHEDLASDGTHPSMAGRQKVALMLLHFLKSDPTARPWFVREGAPDPGPLKTADTAPPPKSH